jgi:tetratricopeptide (TPR) repeat protein
MPAIRHFVRSLAIVSLALSASTVLIAHTQQVSVQQLLERGALDEAVQRAQSERDNPESTFLAAQAFTKLEQNGRATEEYARLRDTGDESWKAIGESGAQLLEGNMPAAMDAAVRAVHANGDNAYAHYQVGIVASRQSDFQRAAEAFGRSVELKPDLAYGHYYAGLASQRLKQTAQMSRHLEAFMRLAPEAPERAAVSAILRTLRP